MVSAQIFDNVNRIYYKQYSDSDNQSDLWVILSLSDY